MNNDSGKQEAGQTLTDKLYQPKPSDCTCSYLY